AYGNEHPYTIGFTANLADVFARSGNAEEAIGLYREVISRTRAVRGPDHENIAGLEMNLAHLLIDRGQFGEAERLIRDAFRLRLQAGGPNSPNTATAEGLLGMVLTRGGKYDAAESALRESLQTMERQIGRAHHDVREVYGWLADLDVARGRRDDAARHRAIATAR